MAQPAHWTVNQIIEFPLRNTPSLCIRHFCSLLKQLKDSILTSRQADFFTAPWIAYHPFLAAARRTPGSDFTYAPGDKTDTIPGKESHADCEDTDRVEDGVQQVLLHHPVGVGGWVAGDTQSSKSQGKEEVGRDAANDDQHVDPRLQDKKHRANGHGLPGVRSCVVETTCLGSGWMGGRLNG